MSDNFWEHLQGDSIALLESDRAVSYSELAALADKSVEQIGGERKLVFLYCQNTIECVAAYLGCLRRRHIPMLLPGNLSDEMSNRLSEAYRPDAYIRVGFGGAAPPTSPNGSSPSGFHRDLALLLATSGSTGSQKYVRLSYKNIQSAASMFQNAVGISADDRAINSMPINYVYGLSVLHSHLIAGASVLLTGKTVTQREFWDLLRENRATNFGGVPFTYETLKKMRFDKMDVPSLRFLHQAGGKLFAESVEWFGKACAEKGIRFYVRYGQTEALGAITILPYDKAVESPGSAGKAIGGGKVEIEDGELVFTGDSVCLGYAENRADLAKGDENHGMLHTGDMARYDDEGLLYIIGRKKRFLKIYGTSVSLDSLEALIRASGYDVAAAGYDDNLIIYTTSENTEEIRKFTAKTANLHISTVNVFKIDEIPRNDRVKIDYLRLPAVLEGQI